MGDLLAGAWLGGRSVVVGDDEDVRCAFDDADNGWLESGQEEDFKQMSKSIVVGDDDGDDDGGFCGFDDADNGWLGEKNASNQ